MQVVCGQDGRGVRLGGWPVGVAALTVITAANTYVQTSVVPEVRGRVLALYLMLFMGGGPIGAPTVGWIAETFGARWSLAGGGLLALLFTGAAALILDEILRVRKSR